MGSSVVGSISIRKGGIVAGRYSRREEIGHGGEAGVFLCSDAKDENRNAVLNLYRTGLKPDGRVLNKVKSVQHPNLLNVVDTVNLQGHTFVVINLARGGVVEGPLSEDEMRSYVIRYLLNAIAPRCFPAQDHLSNLPRPLEWIASAKPCAAVGNSSNRTMAGRMNVANSTVRSSFS